MTSRNPLGGALSPSHRNVSFQDGSSFTGRGGSCNEHLARVQCASDRATTVVAVPLDLFD
jgi:hypothetical protein